MLRHAHTAPALALPLSYFPHRQRAYPSPLLGASSGVRRITWPLCPLLVGVLFIPPGAEVGGGGKKLSQPVVGQGILPPALPCQALPAKLCAASSRCACLRLLLRLPLHRIFALPVSASSCSRTWCLGQLNPCPMPFSIHSPLTTHHSPLTMSHIPSTMPTHHAHHHHQYPPVCLPIHAYAHTCIHVHLNPPTHTQTDRHLHPDPCLVCPSVCPSVPSVSGSSPPSPHAPPHPAAPATFFQIQENQSPLTAFPKPAHIDPSHHQSMRSNAHSHTTQTSTHVCSYFPTPTLAHLCTPLAFLCAELFSETNRSLTLPPLRGLV
jgi:hypothetical protein